METKKVTFRENVIATVKVLIGFSLAGLALVGLEHWIQ